MDTEFTSAPAATSNSKTSRNCGPPSNPFSIMEQKSNECLNMSPYLWRRTEDISANEPSRIPSNTNHSRAKSIHVSACCNHVLNGLEVFGVIILEGSKKHRKIQVSAEESQAASASNGSTCEKYANVKAHGSGVPALAFTSAPEAISNRAISAFLSLLSA